VTDVQAEETGVRPLPRIHSLTVTEVRESSRNPRKIPERAVQLVAESLNRFGWKQPIVVDADHTIVVGHTRHRAARLLGLTHVPVVIATDLTPSEVDAYRIADNRTSDFTTWDLPELTQQLKELEDEFADVLALADWEGITADAQAVIGGEGGGSGTSSSMDLDLPTSIATTLDGGFQLNVCFHTKEDALAAEEHLLDMPGVFDVRHDF
jgi:hypothetical protein